MPERETLPGAGPVAIVDDDGGIRHALARLVKTIGFDPLTFASAEALLFELDDLRPICVVTDMQMPGMNGIDLLRELRRRRPAIPVMVMTAYPSAVSRETAMSAGAVNFMTKPFDDKQLEDWLLSTARPRPSTG